MKKSMTILTVALACSLAGGMAVAQKAPSTGTMLSAGAPRSVSNPNGASTLTVTIPIDGAQTFELCDFNAVTPGNDTLTVNLGPNAVITGIGSDGTIRSIDPASWLSEAAIMFRGAVQPGEVISLRPLIGSTAPNTTGEAYALAPIDLSDNGLPNITLGATGNLTLEFCETFDDAAAGADSEFVAPSSVTIQCFDCIDPFAVPAIPAPAMSTWSILALLLGLGLVGGVAVRRFS